MRQPKPTPGRRPSASAWLTSRGLEGKSPHRPAHATQLELCILPAHSLTPESPSQKCLPFKVVVVTWGTLPLEPISESNTLIARGELF
ncbi:hypothetical protein TNIN_78551 [Trichonephila inaurata madagascariensis]|uniref:Uncharacterized protein n=1 Tax=Trichonephila inaurata madagascariensis TaxID=2747483 RepID=A0A8X6M719_9ARAC|nr:hypothetical protein TNIN_78551 [Trichonephila inaurata madagascariensis]